MSWISDSMDETGRVPIGEALPGVRLHPMPEESEAPLFVWALVKFQDDDGTENWGYRTSKTPNEEELLGALRVQVAVLENSLVRSYQEEDEEERMAEKYGVGLDDDHGENHEPRSSLTDSPS